MITALFLRNYGIILTDNRPLPFIVITAICDINGHMNRIVHVLALGVYLSSLVKDLICSPRPFAPPVTRLSEFSFTISFIDGLGRERPGEYVARPLVENGHAA